MVIGGMNMITGLNETVRFNLDDVMESAYKVEDFDTVDIDIFVGKFDGYEIYKVNDIKKYNGHKYIALFVG